ncbi:glycosyltransferase family 1 protein [Parapedobacter lycopersici]|uniref:glycosyltransferase family 4 protein n=1 Tax=Parapedobacter lycopersici TaxID=1864939 RepID=UPI003341A03A
MNIGYDAKRIFHNRTGLGNYGRDLIRILSTLHPEHRYWLYNPGLSDSPLYIPDNAQVIQRQPATFFDRKFPGWWRRSRIGNDLQRDGISLFHGLSGELPVGLRRKGIRQVVTVHDLIFMRYPKWYRSFDRQIYWKKLRHACRNADKIVAISAQTRSDLVEFLGIDSASIQVIYQGCDPVFRQPHDASSQADVIRKYRLPQDFILNVGTIEPRKNVLSAVKALKGTDVHLVIAGRATTPYANDVKAYVQQHGLTNQVTFIHGASTAELAMLYQATSLFIYPSLYEGFGIPIIEALSAGTPVITTRGGCFPEAGGPHTWYVSPDDVEEIRHAITTLLTDTALQREVVAGGREYVRQFEDHTLADQWITLYQEIIST